METLYFPGLNFGVELNPVAFQIGSISVYWYGIIIAVGFLAALIYCFSRIKEFGLNADSMIDVIVVGVLGAIAGGRLYYVAFKWDYYSQHPADIVKTWEGGMAIYGAIIGAVLLVLLMCRIKKLPFSTAVDFASCGLLIGQAFGRWGNFINVEAFGGNTDLPWGMTSTSISRYLASHAEELEAMGMTVDSSMPVHPCFFYESLWCLIGFILLALYTKRRKFDGELALMYVAWYGIGRSFIEGLRTDSLVIGTLRVSQLLAVLSAIAAIVAIIVIRRKISRSDDPNYLRLYVDTDASKNYLADRTAEAEKRKQRKASRKDDLVRAEELYQRKKLEKAEEKRSQKEAARAAREEELSLEEENDEEQEAAEQENDGIESAEPQEPDAEAEALPKEEKIEEDEENSDN